MVKDGHKNQKGFIVISDKPFLAETVTDKNRDWRKP
jgi:hypothetical protein